MTESRPAESAAVLGWLLDPVTPAAFLAEHWEHRPLLISRDEPKRYAHLLTLDDIDRLLTLAGPTFETVRIVQGGQSSRPSSLAPRTMTGHSNTLETVYARFRQGASIVLNGVQGYCEPVRELARGLGAELGAKIQGNVYLTPAGSRGFKPHYDTHDVYVLQLHGTKHWQLFGAPRPLPLLDEYPDPNAPMPKNPQQELDLRPGDLLYLPRGTVHAATANERVSAHLTVSANAVLWEQLITRAIADLVHDDLRFRAALPPGLGRATRARVDAEATLAALLDELRTRLDPSQMLDTGERLRLSLGPPDLRGHLTDLAEAAAIGLHTPVRRRDGLLWRLREVRDPDADAVELDFHGKTVRFECEQCAAVRFAAASTAAFTAADLPGSLTEPERVAIIIALIREGFLTGLR